MLRRALPFVIAAAGLAVVACTSTVTGSGTSSSSSSSSGSSSGDTSSSSSSGNVSSSSSGATSTSSGATSSGGPAPPVITLSIDGSFVTVSDSELWAEMAGPGQFDLFLRFATATYPSGTDIVVHAERQGTGCAVGNNGVAFRPANDTQYLSAQTSTCGLNIMNIPLTKLGRFKGSFTGQVTAINGPVKTHSISVSFDIGRED
jgi:hypothetical protein